MTAMVLLSEWMASQVEFWMPTEYIGYDVSSFGRVRSYWKRVPCGTGAKWELSETPQSILRAALSRDRYMQVGLRTRKSQRGQVVKMVHRLSAIAFLPNPENKPQVNHVSTLKADNRLGNLEWASRSRNMKHAFDNGLYDHVIKRGESNHLSVLTESQVREIRSLAGVIGKKGKRIAETLGVSRYAVYGVLNGVTWKHVH